MCVGRLGLRFLRDAALLRYLKNPNVNEADPEKTLTRVYSRKIEKLTWVSEVEINLGAIAEASYLIKF